MLGGNFVKSRTENQCSKNAGYSLIELMIIIVIISIIAVIAFPKYSEYKRHSEMNADMSTCKVIYDTIHILIANDEPINDTEIGNLINRGWPTPQSFDGVKFTYTTTDPIIVKTSTPGVQHPNN